MKYLRYGLLILVMVVLLTIAVANRGPVVLRILPEGLANALGGTWAVQVPLFLVILGAAMLGILIGFVWEWIREHRHRATARTKSRQAARLEREVTQLRQEKTGLLDDDVLALLENGGKAR